MIQIKELANILPLSIDDMKIDFISIKDLDWYTKNLRSKYYEEYLDFKFSSDIKESALTKGLYNMAVSYMFRTETDCEARLLLFDSFTNVIYGGCSIFERDKSLELSYFIVPQYQNKGLAYQMMSALILELAKSKLNFSKFILTVRIDNKASMKLAKKLKFKELKEIKGKYKSNKILYLDRKEVYNDIKQE